MWVHASRDVGFCICPKYEVTPKADIFFRLLRLVVAMSLNGRCTRPLTRSLFHCKGSDNDPGMARQPLVPRHSLQHGGAWGLDRLAGNGHARGSGGVGEAVLAFVFISIAHEGIKLRTF